MRVGRSWAARGLLVVLVASSSVWWFLLVVFFLVGIFGSWSSWWPVCGEAVRGATRSSELAVGGESGHGTRDADWRRHSAGCVARTCASVWRALAGPMEGRSQPRLSGLPWQQTSRLVHRGTSRVQVTCNGLMGPFQSPRLHVIKVYGPCLAHLSLRVVFSFLLNEFWCCRL